MDKTVVGSTSAANWGLLALVGDTDGGTDDIHWDLLTVKTNGSNNVVESEKSFGVLGFITSVLGGF